MKNFILSVTVILCVGVTVPSVASVDTSDAVKPSVESKDLRVQITDPFNGLPVDVNLYADINGYRVFVSCIKCLQRLRSDFELALQKIEENGERPLTVEEAEKYRSDILLRIAEMSDVAALAMEYPSEYENRVYFPEVQPFVNADSDTTLTFELQGINNTDEVLVFTHVKTACDCSTVEILTENVAPKERIRLKVRFATKGLSGVIEKKIYLFAKNMPKPYAISFKGSVSKGGKKVPRGF